ncbi:MULTISPECIES: hypothetical protein [unclassified Brevundimonas]|uniref:hypothetical protein n=1 Tax=unclassified Brevundimonas TaxID=2622653 RepID=UPI000CFC283A|nr:MULTISPECIES: hypothetical protein [unclassified Brevundimonas]PRA27661.1 hypothetical protein CQ024_11280 [Brevundimonas sp. MYb27]PQZ74975.1 hypothetical protein CQ026_15215 [Brevundimonas sp. MYb31]PRB17621.1 hypothetical protein CQ039_00855 [Brevundimonas sp. MYb52]PRB37993.1 hypothetical protein CQ035_00855 [Brevundimonas sp. MYb46]PRB45377.1 hypothetical protein CQ028_13130 [Brevundimonas sp. MYb33]
MTAATALLAVSVAGTAFALGLALGRRLISALRLAQIAGGLGCGLIIALAASQFFAGGGHG